MKRKHVKVGDRVITQGVGAFPFHGRVGTVMKVGRMTIKVFCDEADALGRNVVRVTARDLQPWAGVPTKKEEAHQ